MDDAAALGLRESAERLLSFRGDVRACERGGLQLAAQVLRDVPLPGGGASSEPEKAAEEPKPVRKKMFSRKKKVSR